MDDERRKLERHLTLIGACGEARIWTKGKTLDEAWEQCERADWMIWFLAATDCDDSTMRLLACDFAAHVLSIWRRAYPEDGRPANAIRVARRYARGHATQGRLAAARAAAWDASRAAAGAAAWAAAQAAAWAAAGDAESRWQANAIRKRVPSPPSILRTYGRALRDRIPAFLNSPEGKQP